MSIDFTKLQSLKDEKGVVTQITDEAGNVLWKANKPVTVYVTIPSGSNRSVIIDGIEYTESGTYEALESISVKVQGILAQGFAATAYVYLNGVQVASTPFSPPTLTYSLSFDGCSEIAIEYKYRSPVYNCYITEIPEGHALVDITNGAYADYLANVTVNGTKYYQMTSFVVPVGTVIQCFVADNHQYTSATVSVVRDGVTTVLYTAPNGSSGTYDYTVTGNISIAFQSESNSSYGSRGCITITET